MDNFWHEKILLEKGSESPLNASKPPQFLQTNSASSQNVMHLKSRRCTTPKTQPLTNCIGESAANEAEDRAPNQTSNRPKTIIAGPRNPTPIRAVVIDFASVDGRGNGARGIKKDLRDRANKSIELLSLDLPVSLSLCVCVSLFAPWKCPAGCSDSACVCCRNKPPTVKTKTREKSERFVALLLNLPGRCVCPLTREIYLRVRVLQSCCGKGNNADRWHDTKKKKSFISEK